MPETKEKPLRIVALTAENVKRLKAVRIQPDGSPLVPIRGRNAQGKSSVLDAIEYALAGGRSLPVRPVRDGADKASVRVDLGEFVVVRTFTAAGGTALAITSADGTAQYKRPQEILDRVVGPLSFDPLAFTRLKDADQAAELARVAGIDLDAHEAQAKALETQRRDAGRDVKRLETEIAAITIPADTPDESIDLSEITAKNEAARKVVEQNTGQRRALDRLVDEIEAARRTLQVMEDELAAQKEALGVLETAHTERAAEVAALVDPDTSGLSDELRAAQATNTNVIAKRLRAAKSVELEKAQKKHAAADTALTAHRSSLAEAVKSAQLPVPDLALTESGVTLRGIPFAQASSAEQLRVATAIAIAQNPRLRVALIRDGSLLDADSQRLLAEIAEQNDLQVWIEMVGSSADGVGVVIEDGEVVAPVEAQS